MKEKAWLLYLSSDNYYVYLVLSLYKNLLDTNTKYPVYCGVTKDVSQNTRNILSNIGIKLLELDTTLIDNCKIVKENTNASLCSYYKQALTKLAILNTNIEEKFDKIVYLDSDLWVLENIDELMNYSHMSAVINRSPIEIEDYKLGQSVFCSGLFVWDFEANPGLGKKLLESLDDLDQSIAWHDQSIMNYWYKDWKNYPNLHLSYMYGLMNGRTIEPKNQSNIKIRHMVNRVRDEWPFNSRTPILKSQLHFYDWAAEVSKAITYFNLVYDLKLEPIHVENLVPELERETYLYF